MESIGSPALWVGFIGFVIAMLALDLGVFHRQSHAVSFREAAIWSAVWVALSFVFAGGIWHWFGPEPALLFVTGYLIEKSLSVDNIFVFVLIFQALAIPPRYQHRVLFWGILTALLLRGAMIFAGVALLAKFHWLIYVFGGFLIYTGAKLLASWRKGEDEEDVGDSRMMRALRRLIPSTPRLDGDRFFTMENGRRLGTPLFMSLVLVELSDVVFALDSVPAIFAITTDPFLVFTSNIFAILGLRSLFFLVGNLVDRFSYLKLGLAGVLVFVGLKMVVVDFIKVPAPLSLGIIALLLGGSVVASMLRTRREGGDGGVSGESTREHAPGEHG